MKEPNLSPLVKKKPFQLGCLSFFSEAIGGPLQFILNGCDWHLKQLLSRGLSANTIIRRRLLLNHAIYSRQIGIAALLLLYGADPNKASVGYSNRQLMAGGDIFIHDYYNESLAFLLLTYGANYEHKDRPSNHNDNFHHVWTFRHNRLKLHETLLRANQHFDEQEFIHAEHAYAEAISLLEGFLETEQIKLANQEIEEVEHAELTHPNILRCYQYRLDDCRSKLVSCQQAHHRQSTDAIGTTTSEHTFDGPDWEEPLLPVGEENGAHAHGLRKRHGTTKLATL